ncbi:MAG: TolC family protein [Rhodocyclaceae bacterium]|jgi:cobalt-zinc-cadmium efflux system outer membrane protein|nr:TolC family protein [Rhodocyclaceae bacterium]
MRALPLWLTVCLTVGGVALAQEEAGLGGDVAMAVGGHVEQLLAFARERHPEFAALRHEAAAAALRIDPAGALPDPMFGIELRDFATPDAGPNLLPSRVGSTRYTVTQSLPWFGKRDLKRDIAAAAASEAQGRAETAWVDLAWQIKQTFAQHYLHQTRLRYGRENLDLLERLERITLARYTGGLAPQQDVIRAQTERTALESELVLLEGENAQTAARLKSLLGADAGVRLAPPERLRPLPPAARLDAAALEARLVEASPRLATETARIGAAEKSRELAYRNRYPDVSVGLAAIQSRSRVTGYDLMFEINIPLQQDSRRAQEREAERMLDAAKNRRQAALNQARSELNENLAALHAARRVEELVSTRLLPQAELTLQAALAGYETGKVDFATVLDAQRQIRKAKEDLVRARVAQELRRADLERAIGEEL